MRQTLNGHARVVIAPQIPDARTILSLEEITRLLGKHHPSTNFFEDFLRDQRRQLQDRLGSRPDADGFREVQHQMQFLDLLLNGNGLRESMRAYWQKTRPEETTEGANEDEND